MNLKESVIFLEFRHEKQKWLAACQLEIEIKEFKRFSTPYKTDKYLSVVQWEEIEYLLIKQAKKQIKINGLENLTKGNFPVDDLTVKFEVIPKHDSYINFTNLKFNYKLNWIIQAKIRKTKSLPSPLPTPTALLDINANNEVPEYNPTKTYTPSDKTSPQNKKAPIEYSPHRVNNEDQAVQTYTPSRIKEKRKRDEAAASAMHDELFGSEFDISDSKHLEDRALKSTYVMRSRPDKETDDQRIDIDDDLIEKPQDRQKRRRKYDDDDEPYDERKATGSRKQRVQKKVASENQPKITSMLETLPDPTPSKITKRQKIPSRLKTKEYEDDTFIKAIQMIDEPMKENMNKFLSKMKTDNLEKEQRKEELKDLKILDCNDITNDELKILVENFASKIKTFFSRDTVARDERYSAMNLTTSNVLTESQIQFVCNEIEKQRDEKERGSKEEIMFNTALPEFIIFAFRNKFGYDRQEALKQLKIQEERELLYPTDHNDF